MELTYRKGAINYVFNSQNQILIINPINYQDKHWSFPSGGREKDEDVIENALRELKEEVNIDKSEIEVIGIGSKKKKYDYPKEIIEDLVKKKIYFKGQTKDQVVLKYLGDGDEIKPQPEEVRKIKWVNPKDLNIYLAFEDQLPHLLETLEEVWKDALKFF